MRVLVTNDDGIHAPGLEIAERIARTIADEVWVVAPETDQSGIAHALTLSEPLRVRDIDERHFAVKGTPTDCVIMGVKSIMDAPPDLVLSGVNRGQNIADDVLYSGTVAGAMEGTLLGIPSIALSQAYGFETRRNPIWETALTHGPKIVERLFAAEVGQGVLVNVNFPNCSPAEVVGTRVTRQGRRVPDWLKIDEREDGRGHPYFWIGFQKSDAHPDDGSDLEALAQNKISITPLHLDLTLDAKREELERALL